MKCAKAMPLETSRLFELLLFLSIFAMALQAPLDTDMWWHLAAGRFSPTLRPLRIDIFSHTVEGSSWLNHSWLAQHFLYALYRLGGLQAIALATACLVTLTFLAIYPRRGNPYIKGFSLLLVALASSGVWTPRPQLFSFLAFAFVLRRLESLKGKADFFLIPIVFVLWANLHAGYSSGLLLLSLSLIGSLIDSIVYRDPESSWRAKALTLILLLSVLGVCFNPWGPELLLYPFKTLRIKTLQAYIQEWASPDFHLLINHPAIWLTIAIIWVLAFSGIPAKWSELLPLSAFFYFYLVAVRNVAFYSLVAAQILFQHGELALRRFGALRPLGQKRPINTIILGLALIVVALRGYYVLGGRTIRACEEASLPAKAVDFILKEGLSGNLFNSYNWGGYLIWHLYPNCRVFVDGRTDLYGDEVLEEYLQVVRADKGWEEVLEKHKVEIVIVEKELPIARCLELRGGWRKVYEDSLAVVFVK